MMALLLILIPLSGGLICFFATSEKAAKNLSLFISILTLAVALAAVYNFFDAKQLIVLDHPA